MNIQRLIERYEKFKANKKKMTSVDLVLKDLRSLDEPEKVKVPQFVWEYIEQAKNKDYHLLGAMIEIRSHKNKEIDDWFYTDDNIELFARAWLDGYEVEKEKRYLVKIKGNIKENTLVYGELLERYFFTKGFTLGNAIYHHTHKELEEADFGWVFDCPGIEIEEV